MLELFPSIHVPKRGRRKPISFRLRPGHPSIHVPKRGRLPDPRIQPCRIPSFNPRPQAGTTLWPGGIGLIYHPSIHVPKRGRLDLGDVTGPQGPPSIHVPKRGRRLDDVSGSNDIVLQSTSPSGDDFHGIAKSFYCAPSIHVPKRGRPYSHYF